MKLKWLHLHNMAKMRQQKMYFRNLKTVFLLCIFGLLAYFIVSHVSLRKSCHDVQTEAQGESRGIGSVHTFILRLLNLSVPVLKPDSVDGCEKSFLVVSSFILTEQLWQDLNYVALRVYTLFVNSCRKFVEWLIAVNSWEEDKHSHGFGKLQLAIICLFSVLFIRLCFIWFRKFSSNLDSDSSKKTYPSNNHLSLFSPIAEPRSDRGLYLVSSGDTEAVKMMHHHKSAYRMPSSVILWSCLYLMGFVVLLSIPWEFVRLYQKAVSVRAANMNKGLPSECDPQTKTWFDSLKSLFKWQLSWSHDEDMCDKYYYAVLVDPLWDVNPLVVLTSVLSRGILQPLEMVSSSLGRSIRMFFSEIPAQWQPVLMLVSVASFLVFLLVLYRYRLSIPLLFRLEPKTPVHTPRVANSSEAAVSEDTTWEYNNHFTPRSRLSLCDFQEEAENIEVSKDKSKPRKGGLVKRLKAKILNKK